MATKKSRMTVDGWRRSHLLGRALQLNLDALHMAHGDQVDLVLAQRSVRGFVEFVEQTIDELLDKEADAQEMPPASAPSEAPAMGAEA